MNAYIKLILAYLKIGLFGFGGGYAMLSLIQWVLAGLPAPCSPIL